MNLIEKLRDTQAPSHRDTLHKLAADTVELLTAQLKASNTAHAATMKDFFRLNDERDAALSASRWETDLCSQAIADRDAYQIVVEKLTRELAGFSAVNFDPHDAAIRTLTFLVYLSRCGALETAAGRDTLPDAPDCVRTGVSAGSGRRVGWREEALDRPDL